MVPKLEVESVHALHLEGRCAHLCEKLTVYKCTKSCCISRHIGVNFSPGDKHRLSCLRTRCYEERKGSKEKK